VQPAVLVDNKCHWLLYEQLSVQPCQDKISTCAGELIQHGQQLPKHHLISWKKSHILVVVVVVAAAAAATAVAIH